MMLDPKHAENSPRAEVLRLIQKQGSASIKDLESALGVTATAVREQVAHLLHEGFFHGNASAGRDRPALLRLFPHREGAGPLPQGLRQTLAILLLEEVRAEYEVDGLRTILNRVSRRLADKFAGQAQGEELAQKTPWRCRRAGRCGHGSVYVAREEPDRRRRRLRYQDAHMPLF